MIDLRDGDKCSVNGLGDLRMDRDQASFIGKECIFIKITKSGLVQVALAHNTKKMTSVPQSNITIADELHYTKEEQLSAAIKIAVTGHHGVYDKGGKPYILHPLHLMNQLMFDLQLATIAVLHDTLEDCGVTKEYLRSVGFSERVVVALELLTHDPDDSYEEYIEKICGNIDAIRVKRKDLEHNSSIMRLKGVSPKDIARIEKYHRAFLKLGEAKKNFRR